MSENKDIGNLSGEGLLGYASPDSFSGAYDVNSGKLLVVEPLQGNIDMGVYHGYSAALNAEFGAREAAKLNGKNSIPNVEYTNFDPFHPAKSYSSEMDLRRRLIDDRPEKIGELGYAKVSYDEALKLDGDKLAPNSVGYNSAKVASLSYFGESSSPKPFYVENSNNPLLFAARGNKGAEIENLGKQNDGYLPEIQNNPNLVWVGDAKIGENSVPFLEKHSTRSGPDIVSPSAFDQGLATNFIIDKGDYAERFERTNPYSFDVGRAADLYANQLYTKQTGKIVPASLDADQGYQDFYLAKTAELEGSEEFKTQLQEVDRAAYDLKVSKYAEKNANVQLAPELTKNISRGQDGFERNVNGTSFSTPYVAGHASYYMAQNPNLTPQEVEAALYSSAKEVPLIEKSNGEVVPNPYAAKPNSRGLTYDPVATGHGMFDPKGFKTEIDKINQIRSENPELGVAEKEITIPSVGQSTVVDGRVVYKVAMPENATVTRIAINNSYNGNSVPTTYRLVSPNGTVYDIQAANSGNLSNASTSGFYGEPTISKEGNAEWEFSHDQNGPDGKPYSTLKESEIKVNGVEKGGVLDRYLEQNKANILEKEKKLETSEAPEFPLPEKVKSVAEDFPKSSIAPELSDISAEEANQMDKGFAAGQEFTLNGKSIDLADLKGLAQTGGMDLKESANIELPTIGGGLSPDLGASLA